MRNIGVWREKWEEEEGWRSKEIEVNSNSDAKSNASSTPDCLWLDH
jgi:hypothetical protein